MAKQMEKLNEALDKRDLAAAKQVYSYLGDRLEDHRDSGYDNYEIVTCHDLSGDVIEAIESGSNTKINGVRTLFDYLYNDGPKPNNATWQRINILH